MKKIIAVAVLAVSVTLLAYVPQKHTNVTERSGITYSQLGGVNTSNEVVTLVDIPKVIRSATNSQNFVVFSNAVAAVTPPIEQRAEQDPHISSWARKTGNADAPVPIPEHIPFSIVTNGTGSAVTAKDVGAVPTNITEVVRISLSELLYLFPNGTTNGIRVSVSGRELDIRIDTNANVIVFGDRKLSDYGITDALKDDVASLTNSVAFTNAVVKVSPPVALPAKWALANVTNAQGGTVAAADVSALPDDFASLTNNVAFTGAVARVSPPADVSVLRSKTDLVKYVDKWNGTSPWRVVTNYWPETAYMKDAVEVTNDPVYDGGSGEWYMLMVRPSQGSTYTSATVMSDNGLGADSTVLECYIQNAPVGKRPSFRLERDGIPHPTQYSILTSDETIPLSSIRNSSGGTVTAVDVNALPSGTTHLSGDVPTTRTINGNDLTADIELTYDDVGALPSGTTHLSGDVPVTRKVNNKLLSADIELTATDVGALTQTDADIRYLLTTSRVHRIYSPSGSRYIDGSLNIYGPVGQDKWKCTYGGVTYVFDPYSLIHGWKCDSFGITQEEAELWYEDGGWQLSIDGSNPLYCEGTPDDDSCTFFTFEFVRFSETVGFEQSDRLMTTGTVVTVAKDLLPIVTNAYTKYESDSLTNGLVKVSEVGAVVSAYSPLRYDAALNVTWTNIVNNGHVYYVTVTNANVATP